MALGTIPRLTEINTEIGTSGYSLSQCFGVIEKTGTWDRQSDFSSYDGNFINLVDGNHVQLNAAGGSFNGFRITSGGVWRIATTPPSWLTFQVSEGVSGEHFVGTATANSTGSLRTAEMDLTLVAYPGTLVRFTITQNY